MRGKREKENQEGNEVLKFIRNIIITIIFAIFIAFIINIAPNYVLDTTDKTSLVINYNNVTKSLKSDVYLDENKNIYVSMEDIDNFFDGTIYYDEQYDQIITTSSNKIAVLPIDNNKIVVNGENKNISVPAEVKNVDGEDKYYLPISELDDIYNIGINYIEETNVVTIESLDRECRVANTTKDSNIKYLPTPLSRTIDKIENGGTLTLVPEEGQAQEDEYQKVMTDTGLIGYVKEDILTNEKITREKEEEKKNEENISLVWEYFSEFGRAPDMTGKTLEGVNVVSPTFFELERLGKGELKENVGVAGEAYINWAKENNYEVWALVSNSSLQDTTSEILNDYKLREKLINNILDVALEYDFEGINLDFENMKQEDRDLYSRLVIELAPRLREKGIILSVDVTAPDGSANWSLCYDRRTLGKVADYLVFMAYDQYGVSSETPGTTAGYDWVESSLMKFLDEDRENVDPDKIILAVPFYTRLWREENGTTKSGVLSIKYLDEVVPEYAERVWDDELKQYYSKYEEDGITYELWIEDERSLIEKLSLIEKYDLAGAAYWRRGMENEDIWSTISEIVMK